MTVWSPTPSAISNMANMDVVVFGSCIMDFITYAPRFPKCGETVFGHAFKTGFGGKGANQCIAASRLGAQTAMVGKLGNDTNGSSYLKNFKDNRVNHEYMALSGEGVPTGIAQITVDEHGNNTIVIVGGANLEVSKESADNAEEMIKSAKVLLCQLEVPTEATLAALQLGRKHGAITMLNPAPAQENLPPELYTGCDIFCPNETEAELLIGEPVSTVEEAKVAVIKLLDKGCKQVIITLGEKGCVYASQDDRTVQHVETTRVTPVDTTGAGDAFMGALAFFLSTKKYADMPMHEKLKRSCGIAAISVQREGTQSSYPWEQQVQQDSHLLQWN